VRLPRWKHRWLHVIWVAAGVELFLVPALIAFDVLDSRGQIAAVSIVAVTLVAAVIASPRAERTHVKPIFWVGLGGIVAQIVAAPFLEARLETLPLPESLAPRLHGPIGSWVSALGALGATTIGICSLYFGNQVRAHLHQVPLSYRPAVSRFGSAAMVWAGVEFAFALLFMTALSPTVWNTLRWMLIPILWAGGLTRRRPLCRLPLERVARRDFKRFWAEFDLSG
jgi:hypothetical protein